MSPPVIVCPFSCSVALLPRTTPIPFVQLRSLTSVPVAPEGTSCPHVTMSIAYAAGDSPRTNANASHAERRIGGLLRGSSSGGTVAREERPCQRKCCHWPTERYAHILESG